MKACVHSNELPDRGPPGAGGSPAAVVQFGRITGRARRPGHLKPRPQKTHFLCLVETAAALKGAVHTSRARPRDASLPGGNLRYCSDKKHFSSQTIDAN